LRDGLAWINPSEESLNALVSGESTEKRQDNESFVRHPQARGYHSRFSNASRRCPAVLKCWRMSECLRPQTIWRISSPQRA
jgi:hypothetical protein